MYRLCRRQCPVGNIGRRGTVPSMRERRGRGGSRRCLRDMDGACLRDSMSRPGRCPVQWRGRRRGERGGGENDDESNRKEGLTLFVINGNNMCPFPRCAVNISNPQVVSYLHDPPIWRFPEGIVPHPHVRTSAGSLRTKPPGRPTPLPLKGRG